MRLGLDLRIHTCTHTAIKELSLCVYTHTVYYLNVQILEGDPSTYVVMMEGTGDKAFCAGGDIRGLLCIYMYMDM